MGPLKRFVQPLTWSQMNAVEHPPLMMKQLVQGVCGGLRWLEANNLAVHIATRAVEDGAPCSKKDRRALGVQPPPAAARRGSSPKRAKRRTRQATGKHLSLPLPSPSPNNAPAAACSTDHLAPFSALARQAPADTSVVVPARREQRLVTYDVLDCTFGGGYHTGAVLENGRPYTRVAALDCDEETVHTASEIVSEFGATRFRYYNHHMSEIKALFGEASFDAVMIDPGPSVTQLEDPVRGFLLDDENEHACDMRYCLSNGTSALQYLNTVPQHALASALASYELLTPQQSMKLARAIRQARPINHSRALLDVVEAAGDPLPEDGWATHSSRRKTPMSWSFLVSLRGIINKERHELGEALTHALPMLKDDGRLVVFTRLKWEENMVERFIADHPHALLCYTENVELEDMQNYGHSRHTKMWVSTKVKGSAYVAKNTVTLTDEAVRESSARWMSGLHAGQTYGFPANNFTFQSMDGKERRVQENNAKPPPVDRDEDDDDRYGT